MVKLLICATSFAIFIASGEIAIRIYTRIWLVYDVEMARYAKELKVTSPNPLIGHVHKANSSAHLMGVEVRINADGLRDRNYPVERSNAYRIVFLGDSLTFGWGVRQEETFEALLEEQIGRKTKVEIINFGTGNYNTEQETHLFIDLGLKYRPDKVVLFWFVNDAEPTPREKQWSIAASSELISFLWSRAQKLVHKLSLVEPYDVYYHNLFKPDTQGWIAAQKALLLLNQVCRDNKIELQVILLPEFHDLVNFPFAKEYATLAEFLKSNRIPHLDLTPRFGNVKEPMQLWVAPDDAHPNGLAHKMIAEYSLDFISPEKP